METPAEGDEDGEAVAVPSGTEALGSGTGALQAARIAMRMPAAIRRIAASTLRGESLARLQARPVGHRDQGQQHQANGSQ